jgi:hypothetical protein
MSEETKRPDEVRRVVCDRDASAAQAISDGATGCPPEAAEGERDRCSCATDPIGTEQGFDALDEATRRDMAAWTGCLAGALTRQDHVRWTGGSGVHRDHRHRDARRVRARRLGNHPRAQAPKPVSAVARSVRDEVGAQLVPPIAHV